ncbi:MAG: hypothetical protein Q9201_003963 [Fulgogasparrea decipioides]
MPEAQPEQDNEIQAFRRWNEATRRPGIGGSNHASECGFTPLTAVKEYLGANQRIETLLASLFGSESTRVNAEVVREHYLRTLAVLLLIGEGPMIKHFVQYRSLRDHRLPYRSRPEDFPFSPDPNFFDRFHNQQWQFCAADLEYNMDVYLHKEEILPIISREEIGQGGNAVIFKITVDPEYNKLVPKHWKVPERPTELLDTFVLKTYRGPDAKEQHRAEQDAFMRLRHARQPTPFVVAYYGSFIDDETYNIILEYADGGNLEDFMKSTPQPSTPEDMIQFWDRLCSITHGLSFIHGVPSRHPASFPAFLGYIQFISYCLPVADLDRQQMAPRYQARKHPRAPETLRPDMMVGSFPVQVKPDVDVWSVGCVLSEAAVWSKFGWRRVREYRNRRREEVKKMRNWEGEYIFHDGTEVLSTVRGIHKHIMKEARELDQVTVEILRHVDVGMLLKEQEPRYTAKQVFYQLGQVVTQTREIFGIVAKDVSLRSCKHEGAHEAASELGGRSITPPNVPPGYLGRSKAHPPQPASLDADTLVAHGPVPIDGTHLHSPNQQTSFPGRPYQSQASDGNGNYRRNDGTFTPLCSDSVELHHLPDPPDLTTSSPSSSSLDWFNTLSINTQTSNHPQGVRRSHRETMGPISTRPESSASNKVSLRRSKTVKEPSSYPRRSSIVSSRRSSTELTPIMPEAGNRASLPPKRQAPRSSPEMPDRIPLRRKDHNYQRGPQRPDVTLNDGLLWKEKTKRRRLSRLEGEENLIYMKERDHVGVQYNQLHLGS